MKQLVVICGENKLRCGQILELLSKRNDNIEIILNVTTNSTENGGYIVISNNEFWDMVEQGKFMEYSRIHESYYGTLHINKDKETNQFMINDVDVAIGIKKLYPKAITMYIVSQEKLESFNKNPIFSKVRKLDFLVVDNYLINTAKKIEEIVSFMEENGMKNG